MPVNRKICAKCRENLPASAFSKSAADRTGLQPYCKACFRVYQRENTVRKAREMAMELIRSGEVSL